LCQNKKLLQIENVLIYNKFGGVKMIYNNFNKTSVYKWRSADTETYTLIDGVKVTTSQLNKLATDSEHNTAFFRQHASIDTYAWQISCGEVNAICNTFIEWLETLSIHHISCVWFYNAKFDFAQIDYQILSNTNFTRYDKALKKTYINMYESLHNPFGARYMYTIWYVYENKEHKKFIIK
jgi:hypothetical protein